MGVEIRLPNITGATEKEQLLQLKSYLYQLSEQLQWAFNNIETTAGSGNSSYVVNQVPRGFTASSGSSGGNAGISFAELKSLIIKSTDIVEAYYDEITKTLVGEYIAESDFGTYVKQTLQEIDFTPEGITQEFENTQAIITNLNDKINDANEFIEDISDDLKTSKTDISAEILRVEDALGKSIEEMNTLLTGLKNIVVGVTAYIKSGVLYETSTGVPVYGIEIGQQVEVNGTEVFNKFARFTSEKLSFYDSNGNEVAYISNEKLYISHVEITNSFQEGGYKDDIDTNGGIVTKWVGGNG